MDIALVGVPHSTGNGTTERDQHLGPRAVRNVSARVAAGPWQFRPRPVGGREIADVGDVPFPRANDNEDCIAQITVSTAGRRCRRAPGLGWRRPFHHRRHRAGPRVRQARWRRTRLASCISTPTRTSSPRSTISSARRKSAAHWGAYLADQGQADPKRSMQIGLRGHPRTLDWLQPSYDYGYNVVTMKEFRRRGLEDVVAQARDVLAGRPVYITFDLDCLDPTVAPAVSNLEPGEKGLRHRRGGGPASRGAGPRKAPCTIRSMTIATAGWPDRPAGPVPWRRIAALRGSLAAQPAAADQRDDHHHRQAHQDRLVHAGHDRWQRQRQSPRRAAIASSTRRRPWPPP
jgi:guanidinopropionase